MTVKRYPVVEEKISQYCSTTLSTFFCYVESLTAETMDVAAIFFSF
jgi:hypothetical protein